MRVLALTTYPVEAAATRFRLSQMVAPLRDLGIDLDIRPLLDSTTFRSLYGGGPRLRTAGRVGFGHLRRVGDLPGVRRADVVLLQREAALVGPPLIEIVMRSLARRPLVLDLDDPTWISYDSPTFGPVSRLLKWPGKADWLIDRVALVTCGSEAIVEHVERRGAVARLVPTVVDTETFCPRAAAPRTGLPVVGWIGTHSTTPYLRRILPALIRAAERCPFRLLVVGGEPGPSPPDLDVEVRAWSLEREVADFQSLDVGLYPLDDDAWARGKSGFKSIQYMACGVPFVVSPVGAAGAVGRQGTTHLEAGELDAWADAVHRLVSDVTLRAAMGAAGRAHSLEHYSVPRVAAELAAALHAAA